MSTRMLIRGRPVLVSKDWQEPHDSSPRNRAGEIMDVRVEPHSPDAPFRAGTIFHDKAEDLVYRVIRNGGCSVLEGWRSAAFWIDRWKTDWATLKTLVEKGWLDAAMEEGSAVGRFRCRDEHRVLAWLKDEKAVRRDRRRHKALPRRR